MRDNKRARANNVAPCILSQSTCLPSYGEKRKAVASVLGVLASLARRRTSRAFREPVAARWTNHLVNATGGRSRPDCPTLRSEQ